MDSTENNRSGKLRNRASDELVDIQRHRKRVFTWTFIAYALSHLSRKSYTTCKVEMTEEGLDSLILSSMDTSFMFCYAIGSVGSGRLGDIFHAPTIVSFGLLGSSFCVGLLVLGLSIGLASEMSTISWGFFVLSWGINGLFQSAGGPVGTAIMGNWFEQKNRGWVFGVWTAHQYIGNISAALLTTLVLSSPINWIFALVIPAVLNVLWGLVVMYSLPERPEDVHLETEESARHALSEQLSGRGGDGSLPKAPISFLEACRIPSVLSYSLAFGFIKLINYALFFWLPFFLSQHFSPSSSNLMSILYDVGLLPGGAIVGWLSDHFGGRRASVISIFLLSLVPLLLIFSKFALIFRASVLLVVLGVMGILVGGPSSIITSAVAADLAEHPSIRGNERALGTVTGIINGVGSVTASLGLFLVGPLSSRFGWVTVWYLLIVCALMSVCLLFPKVQKEIFDYDYRSSGHSFDRSMEATQSGFLTQSYDSSGDDSYKGYKYGSITCDAKKCNQQNSR